MAKNSLFGTKKYLLIAGDIIILYFSLYLTLIIRYGQDFTTNLWSQHLVPFTVVFLIWLIISYIDDIYELNFTQGKLGLLVKLLRTMAIGSGLSIVFFYLGQNRLFTIKPQTVLAINIILASILIYLWHLVFLGLTKSSKIANRVIIIGFNSLAKEIIDKIDKNPHLGLQLVAILSEPNEEIPQKFQPLIINRQIGELKNICEQKKVDIIVSITNPRGDNLLSQSLFECLPLKINFFEIASFYEKIMGKIPVNTIEQIWLLENLSEGNKKSYEYFKQISDIGLSIIMLLLSLPFIPLIILAIKIDSRGPIFFTQIRTGKLGKNFLAIKFRTMVQNAEVNGAQWAVKNDPRVTRLGKFLRQTRIDEIPQLINVLRGEMSLIGPRPERPEFIEQLQQEIPFYKERLLTKPGLTGWAQVVGPAYGGSKEESLEKLQYDLYYIKNRSLALDISIILKTIKIVLARKGC
ncbi:MAG: sugar transferase [Patescibacteria group bacterium]|jgi:exopolysaccharide biosynthesis polyprenyl glycosylphosphotransferase|nr:sugar transferase [Patescibacteria group bacterium]